VRVALDASFLRAQRGGDETFMRGLLEGLARRRDPDDTFPLVLSDPAAPDVVRGHAAFPTHLVPSRPGPVHFAATLPRVLRQCGELDLAVSVTHTPLTGSTPYALVLGDLSFMHRPRDYPAATALRLRTLVPRHLRRARAVLVPSEYTRADVLDTFDLAPDIVHVVPNRITAPTPPAEPAAPVAGGRPYLLYLGNLHPRKNVARLITAFLAAKRANSRLAEHCLVIAGARWYRGQAEHDAAGGRPDIVFLGRVSEATRVQLLAHAEALAYVSLFEGFGLPPLEAMAYGVPVLTSSTTSLPEVTGGAALLVDPASPEAIAEGVGCILTDSDVRAWLSAAGPLRAAHFDADRVGDAALAAFRAAIGSQPSATTLRRIR
jgi:glycosyltransferase involved in cell wall biosynthesis